MSLAWLLVADGAIQFVRECGEHASAISYIEAFSKSDFSNLLIKWVTIQTGIDKKLVMPNTPTPKALIKWLLVLQNQGIRVFDQDVSELHAKAAICMSRADYELPAFKPADDNTFFDIGNVATGKDKVAEDQEMVHLLHNPFSAAACVVKSTATHGRRKREEEMNEEATPNKIVKYNSHENSYPVNVLPFTGGDALITGSEVNNPAHGVCTGSLMENAVHDDSDEEMEVLG